ncbi:DUF1698 domain-containing protein [Planktomarina temperata]|nr:DUF1698 domain-containing protein [Planktomarina temperata]
MNNLEKVKKFIEERTYWYHKIDFGGGVVAPGFELDPIWDQIRSVVSQISYTDKSVLDIASFDGMFSFEAEKAGAKSVIATDCLYKSFTNFLFCREYFNSKVIPYYNVSPYNLVDRLDVVFQENYDGEPEKGFDIVQHFGLLYHLRDPMLSLSQARSVMKTNGKLIIETDFVMDDDESKMVFNGLPNTARLRDNYSVWWAPTKKCLSEMLEASFFEVDESLTSEIFFDVPGRDAGKISGQSVDKSSHRHKVGRIVMVAKAMPIEKINEQLFTELKRTYRNPGMDFI